MTPDDFGVDPRPADLRDDPLLAAFHGPGWQPGVFNLKAALIPLWVAWHDMFLRQLAWFLFFIVVWTLLILAMSGFELRVGLPFVIAYAITGVIQGFMAGGMLAKQGMRARKRVLAKGLEGEPALEAMRRAGRPSVLAVVVAAPIGAFLLLAWVPMFGHEHDHGKAYVAAMKSDLRNLVTAEESYFADNVTYTTSAANMLFQTSTGVTITLIGADSLGWSATGKHQRSDKTCGIFVGTARPPVEGANEAEPKCI